MMDKMIKANDGDGHTDEATVELLPAVPVTPTPTPEVIPTPVVTPTSTPVPGFEAVFATLSF